MGLDLNPAPQVADFVHELRPADGLVPPGRGPRRTYRVNRGMNFLLQGGKVRRQLVYQLRQLFECRRRTKFAHGIGGRLVNRGKWTVNQCLLFRRQKDGSRLKRVKDFI